MSDEVPGRTASNHLYRLIKKNRQLNVNSAGGFLMIYFCYSIIPVQLILAPAAPLG